MGEDIKKIIEKSKWEFSHDFVVLTDIGAVIKPGVTVYALKKRLEKDMMKAYSKGIKTYAKLVEKAKQEEKK